MTSLRVIQGYVILLASLSCVQLQMFRSSYFKISSQENLDEEEDFTMAVQVHDEFSCALMCSATVVCHFAIFGKDSKKCSFVKATENLNQQKDEAEPESKAILLEKITIAANNKLDCPSAEKESLCKAQATTKTKKTSCSSILQKDNLSPSRSGVYNITVGNFTWKARCEMNGVTGCGGGVWEQVMIVEGHKDRFPHDSPFWTNKESFHPQNVVYKSKQIKTPGFWLSNLNSICVTMNFQANTSKDATSIVMNYTAPSLYSALYSGVKRTWAADLSSVKTPPNIDKSCLVQGFNMLGPRTWVVKSRIGVESQPLSRCPLPYLVYGVGIGLQGFPDLSCGELVIRNSSHTPTEIYSAFCKIYIQ